jgi:serine/threonine-protein kinase
MTTAWALSSSNNYNPNALLDFLDDPEVSKPAVIEVLKVHKRDLSVHDLMQRAYKMDPKEKAALFAIIEDVVSIDMVPDLINRMGGKDPAIKIHIMRLLSKFQCSSATRTSSCAAPPLMPSPLGKDTSTSTEWRSS